jgi:hypothetical protein
VWGCTVVLQDYTSNSSAHLSQYVAIGFRHHCSTRNMNSTCITLLRRQIHIIVRKYTSRLKHFKILSTGESERFHCISAYVCEVALCTRISSHAKINYVILFLFFFLIVDNVKHRPQRSFNGSIFTLFRQTSLHVFYFFFFMFKKGC